MTHLVLDQLRRLGGNLTHLHGRVREAVAGEVGKAVADSVAEALTLALGGHLAVSSRHAAAATPSRYGRPEWDEEGEDWRRGYGRYESDESEDEAEDSEVGDRPRTEAAVMLALAAGRWWLSRRGSPLAAVGVGVAAAATAMGGGPVARAALAVLWAVDRLMSSTAMLGDGARAIEKI
jgi:hypothetical protein